MNLLSNLLAAVAAFFGYKKQHEELENTPEMKANASAKKDEQVVAKATEEVTKGDVDNLRKDAAE